MGDYPLISVLMTAYNRQQFIAEAIESVLASSYQNWELIIVDDGSTDNTVAIVKRYATRDNRIQLYINEKNLGDYPNRNRAASYAKGEWLKYLDSDDLIFPDALKNMVTEIEKYPNAAWGISNFLDGLNELKFPYYLNKEGAYLFHYFKRPIFFASPGLTIISKQAFETVGGFGEKRMVSDFEMWHKLSEYSPLILMPGNMVYIRRHAGQEVQDQQKFVVEYEKVKLNYFSKKECPLTVEQIKRIKKNRRNTVFKIAIKKLAKFDFRAARPRLKIFWFYLWN